MIEKKELESIAQDSLNELGIQDWNFTYADAEPEEKFYGVGGKSDERIATNLRFQFGAANRRSIHIRFRLEPEHYSDKTLRNSWIKDTLKARIQQIKDL